MSRALRLLALSIGSIGAGCVSLTWSVLRHDEPIAPEAVKRIAVVGTELANCLAELGAPHFVWREGPTVALAYAWVDEGGFGFRVGYSASQYSPTPSFSWDNSSRNVLAVVLRFDRDLHLLDARRGFLQDLAPPKRNGANTSEDSTDE